MNAFMIIKDSSKKVLTWKISLLLDWKFDVLWKNDAPWATSGQIQKIVCTLKKSFQSWPWQRDFKDLTAVFHEDATDQTIWHDFSSDKWKCDAGIFSIE